MGCPRSSGPKLKTQLADLLTHDNPNSPNRSTFWLTTLNGRRKPARDERGRALARGAHAGSRTGERTRKAKNVARRPALHDQCRHEKAST